MIKMGEGDEHLEEKLHRQGYEVYSHPLPTREAAAAAQSIWQEQINSKREQGLF
ncbi:MAG: hypothetical protein JOY85_04795 [Acidobacteriaceae bacterium]|nr:hypothetical protein [Acidobacteriaceae bacterium]